MLVVDQDTQKLRESGDLLFVDKILALKKKGKHWEAIDLVVNYWIQKNPKRYRSFLIEVDEKRKTRGTVYGSNKSKSIRSLLDIPEDVIYTLRKLYSPQELSFDKEFYNEMYKRYPYWRVAEKL